MSFLPQEVIRKKRDGETLTGAELARFVAGITDGSVTEGQIAAFAMAVYFQGMTMEERTSLALHMMHSGDVMDWSQLDLNGPVLDKHSTGGVGDKVSLMLGPMIAACGGYVPMISGRGLGHTGGTLDKFDAIPGYNTAPDNTLLRRVVKELGCAIIGQTANLAPADKRFYATRDVTATIESIPLITASILSKKLTEGLDALVIDVKTGNGAFAEELSMAQELSESLVTVACSAGVKTSALITDMNQVLGTTVGNALEVVEAIDYLSGQGREPRLHEVVIALAAEALVLGGLADDLQQGRIKAQQSLDSGTALECFSGMVSMLGGPKDFVVAHRKYLPAAPVIKPFFSPRNGFISAMNTREVGIALIELGGGRTRAADDINHAVGFSGFRAIGEAVEQNEALAWVHADSESAALHAMESLNQAIKISEHPPKETGVIIQKF